MQSDLIDGVAFRDSLFATGDSSANWGDRRGMASNMVLL
jgi:hypothetical protein